MKKLLYLFCASLLVLVSCSSDDNNSSEDMALILPKKIIVVSNGMSHTMDYVYNGNKIISAIDGNGFKIAYTYTGDLITKVVQTEADGSIYATSEYVYANGKLFYETSLEAGDDYKYKTKYTYNSDGTISFQEFLIDIATEVELESGYAGKYTFKDGNIAKVEKLESGSYSNLITYEYDVKNNPFKNILGYNLLFNNGQSVNNPINGTYSNAVVVYTYTYDANGFPIEEKMFYDGELSATINYTY